MDSSIIVEIRLRTNSVTSITFRSCKGIQSGFKCQTSWKRTHWATIFNSNWVLHKHKHFVVLHFNFLLIRREMTPHRLARVSESNEEVAEAEIAKLSDNNSPLNASPSLKRPSPNRSPRRSSNSLHVTINDKPEDIDCDGNLSHHSNTSSRRPSALIQEILSSRRPSAIMAALRSPKQFVNRYRRECVNLYFTRFGLNFSTA